MTLNIRNQHKSSVTHTIVDKLRKIIELTGWSKTEIAQKLGVQKTTIYRAETGVGGSEQLKMALDLLLQVVALERALVKKIADENRLKQAFGQQAFDKIISEYPKNQPNHSQLNEDFNSSAKDFVRQIVDGIQKKHEHKKPSADA